MVDLAEQLVKLGATHRRVAMATLLAARGGSPRPVGTRMFVAEGGQLLGSVSIGGCVDTKIAEHGQRLLREDRWEVVTARMDDTEAAELGLACGAEFDLLIEPVDLGHANDLVDAYADAARRSVAGRETFVKTELVRPRLKRSVSESRPRQEDSVIVERIAPAESLVIVGASDVGVALAELARRVGFRVSVVDGRERLATRERFPDADEVLAGIPSEIVRPRLGASTYLVLLVHDYKYELPVLREALKSGARYVGMLAGRKRADGVRAMLRDDGMSDDAIARLHAPVGLDIGGREPGEIAVSILAQMIAVREGKPIAAR